MPDDSCGWRAHAHRRVPHPARRGPRGARGRGHHAARPQRRRQDDDAAHDHGPVPGQPGRDPLPRPGHPRPRDARHRADWASPTCPRPWASSPTSRCRRTWCSPPAPRATPANWTSARLDWIFGLFPALKKFWLYPAGKLSGGQKQMLAVARAIVEPRALILIDEPSKGLAPSIVQNLIGALRELKAQRTTILLVEQNFQMARALGDTVAVMDDGRVVHRGAHGRTGRRRSPAAAAAGPVAGSPRMTTSHRGHAGRRRRGRAQGQLRLAADRAAGGGDAAGACRPSAAPAPGSRSPWRAWRWGSSSSSSPRG